MNSSPGQHVQRGDRIQASGADVDQCVPDAALHDELELLYEEGLYDFSSDATPVDAGNFVGDLPCGWFRTLSSPDEDSRWRLLPIDFQERAESVVGVSAWQTMSMTGAVLSGGCQAAGELAVAWSQGDEGYNWIEVRRDIDRGEIAVEICTDVLGDGDPSCPEISEHGWELNLNIAEDVPLEAVARCLDIIWRPCGDEPAHEELEINGRAWRWHDNTRWVLRGKPASARPIAFARAEDLDDPATLEAFVATVIAATKEGGKRAPKT